MKSVIALVASLLFAISFQSFAAEKKSAETCKPQAISEAKKLLAFYRDNDDRAEIDDHVTPLAKIQTRKINHNTSMYCRYGEISIKANIGCGLSSLMIAR
jgi:hypothetical protein